MALKIATVPAAPLLVPEVAAGAAPELAELREAAREAVRALREGSPEALVVVGAAADRSARGVFPPGSPGSFRPFGVDRGVRLGGAETPPDARVLPRSLAVGAWLVADAGWAEAPAVGLAVGPSASPERCLQAGRELVEDVYAGQDLAVLVLADGSACRTLKAPGYLDPRAEGYDAALAAALAAADADALAALDPGLSAELQAEGRAPWQVAAGAAQAHAKAAGAQDALTGRLLREEAPYGVGYFVSLWS
ncbi:class III extradiol ring-cleavage dioxygenase family protein [Phaeacidiphilus oryzae]|uniref:hypothetical protein n=1 Tax=Phaeacidiphilus oryzae TaxID=348818 RepID=UPI00056BEA96|nr:hypothetical protein [Phaeacidiphilus oryzae]